MKIIVTGGLGHIGSKLIRVLPRLLRLSKITVIDNLISERYPSLFNLPKTCEYKFFDSDVSQIETINLISDADILIHLAAITNAEKSFDNPEIIEKNNFLSTKILSDHCARVGIKFIHISSTSVYGTQETIVDETCIRDELKPQSPYAETKLKEEDYLKNLRANSGLKFVSCRFGTIFGVSKGMRFHTAVNKFCWQAIHKKPLTIWRTAYTQKRPYLDLNDAVNVVCFIISQNLFDGEIYNVLTLNATVEDIVNEIRKFEPNLSINYVDSKIMNQLSYEVLSEKIRGKGFNFKGNLEAEISKYFELIM